MGWQHLERIAGAEDGLHVDIESDGAGQFRYVLCSWMPAGPEDEGALGDGFWMAEEVSGRYGWLATCRTDAKRALQLRGASE